MRDVQLGHVDLVVPALLFYETARLTLFHSHLLCHFLPSFGQYSLEQMDDVQLGHVDLSSSFRLQSKILINEAEFENDIGTIGLWHLSPGAPVSQAVSFLICHRALLIQEIKLLITCRPNWILQWRNQNAYLPKQPAVTSTWRLRIPSGIRELSCALGADSRGPCVINACSYVVEYSAAVQKF